MLRQGSRGSVVVRLACAMALLAGVIATAVVFFGSGQPRRVDATGAAMAITVFSDTSKTQPAPCDS